MKSSNRSHGPRQAAIPTVTPWLLRGFLRYVRRHTRRRLNAIRVAGDSAICASMKDQPLVIYANHSSWWDPLIAFCVAEKYFPARQPYFPIDAEALERYPVLKRLGFFAIDKDTPRGAMAFLHTARAILEQPDTLLFVTPQGRFADVRERPLAFKHGLAHLATRLPQACFLPAAVELCFWEESTAEALIRFGTPLHKAASCQLDAESWNTKLEQGLQDTMDRLAEDAIRRNPADFHNLSQGKAGVGGIYDRLRAIRSWLSGQPFNPRHSDL